MKIYYIFIKNYLFLLQFTTNIIYISIKNSIKSITL